MKNTINFKKLSVCVPTYERVGMLRQLIHSFIKQTYISKELIISDDSNTFAVKNLIEEFKNYPEIKYFHNKANLGYSANLLKSMERAKGDYLLILGDDDAFLSENAVSQYVKVFEDNPNVGYVYSNQIQFSNNLKIEFLFDIFNTDLYFTKGEESIRNIWLTSIFIPGMGLRNDIDFRKYYPKDNMLFPQLQLVGHILNLKDSFFISDCLIAGRSHNDQLGFMAIQKKLIKGEEKHGTIEIIEIFKYLKKIYKINIKPTYFEKKLVDLYSTMILKEKLITNNDLIKINYLNFINNSNIAFKSNKLRFSYYFALVSPKFLLHILKRIYNDFNKFKKIKKYIILQNKLTYMLES